MRTEPLKEDLDEIAAVVRNASRMADLTTPARRIITSGRALQDPCSAVKTSYGTSHEHKPAPF